MFSERKRSLLAMLNVPSIKGIRKLIFEPFDITFDTIEIGIVLGWVYGLFVA